MGEQLVLELLALGEQHPGRPAAARRESSSRASIVCRTSMVGVGADVVEEASTPGVDLREDPVVDRLGHPPRRLRASSALAERRRGCRRGTREADEHGVEQRAGGGRLRSRDRSPGRRAVPPAWPDARLDDAARGAAWTSSSSSTSSVPASASASASAAACGVAGSAQPGRRAGADAGAARAARRAPRGSGSCSLDELAEAAADLVLAFRDDRRVRDRDARADGGTARSPRTSRPARRPSPPRPRRARSRSMPCSLSAVERSRTRWWRRRASPSQRPSSGAAPLRGRRRSARLSSTHIRTSSSGGEGSAARGAWRAADAASSPPSGTSHLWQASRVTNYTEIVGGLRSRRADRDARRLDRARRDVRPASHRVHPDGTKTTVAEIEGGPNGAAVGPDGAIYLCNNGGCFDARRVRRDDVPRRLRPGALHRRPDPACRPARRHRHRSVHRVRRPPAAGAERPGDGRPRRLLVHRPRHPRPCRDARAT